MKIFAFKQGRACSVKQPSFYRVSSRTPSGRALGILACCAAVGLLLGVAGCDSKPRTGEAFIVLKSDNVVPLADMEVRFLSPEFPAKFEQLKHAYNGETKEAADKYMASLKKALEDVKSELASLNETNPALNRAYNRGYLHRIKDLEADICSPDSYYDQLGFRSELADAYVQKFLTLVQNETIFTTRTGKDGTFVIPRKASCLFAERFRENGEWLCWFLLVKNSSAESALKLSNSTVSSYQRIGRWILDYSLR